MSHQDDPNINRRMDDERRVDRTTGSNMTGWVVAGLAALAVVAVMLVGFSGKDGNQTASNDANRPAATQPASPQPSPPATTGSGSTTDSR